MAHFRLHGLLAALAALTALSMDTYLPAIPAIADSFAVDPTEIRPTIVAFAIGFAIGQLLFAPLSDRFGRRRPLLVALGLYALASLGCAATHDLDWFVTLRAIQGLAGGGVAITFMAAARDRYSGRDLLTVLAWVSGTAALSPVLAPLIGTMLAASLGWRSVFALLTVVGVGLWGWSSRRLQESLDIDNRSSLDRVGADMLATLTKPAFLLPALAHAFAFTALFVFITTGHELLIVERGLSPRAFGMLFSANAGVFAVTNVTISKALRRGAKIDSARLIAWGAGLVLIGGLAHVVLAPMPSAWGIAGIAIGIGIATAGVALVMPASATLALRPFASGAGRASGILGALRFGVPSGVFALVETAFELREPLVFGAVQVGAGVATIGTLLVYRRAAESQTSRDLATRASTPVLSHAAR